MTVSLDATAVPADPGGAGRYVVELAASLGARTDVDIVLWARAGDGDRWRALAPQAEVHAVAPVRRPLRILWEQTRLPRLIGDRAPSVHHGPHYTMPGRVDAPRVVTIHDLTFLDHPEWHQPTKRAFFRRAIRTAAAEADAIVAVSQATAHRLQDLCRPAGPVHVIPHGVDHTRFHPPVEADTQVDAMSLRRLGVRSPYIGFVGTLEPRKDVPSLIRAFDQVAAAHPEVMLVLAGADGWGRSAVDEAVNASPYGGRIRRCGWVEEADKPALFRSAAVVAYPSLEEGFGLPALEAMACGTPLVTTRGSAMEEVSAGAALLVDPGDIDALTSALEAALAGGPEVEQRRSRGVEVASAYTWAASAEAHLRVYRSVS